jgi:hypothetical protein
MTEDFDFPQFHWGLGFGIGFHQRGIDVGGIKYLIACTHKKAHTGV